MDKNNSDRSTAKETEFNDGGLSFSKKLIFRVLWLSVLMAGLVIGSFLAYKEYTKTQVKGDDIEPIKISIPDSRDYSNDYWGFKFQYPGSWSALVSSFEDGDYYFSSDQIDFLGEMEPGQALLEVKTYNNWKGMSFEDWLSDQQTNYLPQGKISNQSATVINGAPAISYIIELHKALNTTKYWDVLALSKNNNIKYLFILETSDKDTHDQYLNDYKKIIKTVSFYKGFGQN